MMGISLGLVGLGSFGSSFAKLFKGHPLVDRVGLCDQEADRLARFAEDPTFVDKFDAKDAFVEFDDICEADFDALVIITQPWLHGPQAVKAMEAGKHVYSAVPVINLPEGDDILDWCDRIVRTCEKTGMRYMMGETTFYRPEIVYCRRMAREGAFGHLLYAEGEYLHDVDSPEANLRKVYEHRTASRSGREWVEQAKAMKRYGMINAPMHYPTHSVSGPVTVMGARMVKVSALGYRDPGGDEFHGDGFSNEIALFRMSNGAIVRINEMRQIGHPCSETARIYGSEASFAGDTWYTRGDATKLTVEQMREPLPGEVYDAFLKQVRASDEYDRLTFYHDKDFTVKSDDEVVYRGHGGSHAFLVHEFVSAVYEGRQPAINAWEAVRYMAPGVMAHQSALKDGEWLEVPDWGDGPG